jgi:4-alpha-glucanotransferase
MPHRPRPARAAGLVVPLFSLRTPGDWGIGEIADLASLGPWMRRAGFQAIQLLPVSTLKAGDSSPYSALSAMAIDPIYLTLAQVLDFQAIGGEARLALADQIGLKEAKAAPRVDYAAVRRVKDAALRLAFSNFWEVDWIRTTPRAGAFAAYCSWEDWWLGDYALYSALRARYESRSWRDWPRSIRNRRPAALETARGELEQEILFHQYTQWLADEQWAAAREALPGVRLLGDFPFAVSTDSADVWAHQHLFRFDRTTGTPPDAFSATGQNWGLPVYRWDVMAAENDGWLRQRARRMSRLFDGYRLDHLVGFFRTYSRAIGAKRGRFDPRDEPSQIAQGERLLQLFRDTGSEIICEDLGLIPDFVRESMARFELPGFKVVRWERAWNDPGHPFLPPRAYPAVSVAATGTHDIEPLALWWDAADEEERGAFAVLLADRLSGAASLAFTPAVHRAILELTYGAGSDLLLLPVQDLFGWSGRINVPATVGEENWTWRMDASIGALEADPELARRSDELRRLAQGTGRLADNG